MHVNVNTAVFIIYLQLKTLRWEISQLPYSGYNLRGAISANHQISYLEVIFAIIKFANHVARLIYAPRAYRFYDYKHRL